MSGQELPPVPTQPEGGSRFAFTSLRDAKPIVRLPEDYLARWRCYFNVDWPCKAFRLDGKDREREDAKSDEDGDARVPWYYKFVSCDGNG